jgi:hypothetical protein
MASDINDEQRRAFRPKQQFYAAVGQAISAWSGMESHLVSIAALLLKTHPEKAGLVLYSNQNFHVWLNILDDLFEIEPMFVDLKDSWTKISSDLRSMNDIRVRLAHHSTHHDSLAAFEQMPRLARPRLDVRTKSRKHQPLTADEIIDFTDKIAATLERSIHLVDIMIKREQLASSDKSSQPPDDQPT